MPQNAQVQQRIERAIIQVEELGGTVAYEGDFKTVELDSTTVSDEDLKILQDLPGVEILGLSHTSITDQGLRHLEHQRKLRTLVLIDTQVTQEGIARLQSKLPDVKISTAPPPSGTIDPFTGKPIESKP